MDLYFINRSTMLRLDETEAIVQALQIQLTIQVAPIWGILPPNVVALRQGNPPNGAAWIAFVDSPSVPNSYGSHGQDEFGPCGEVACGPVFHNDGSALGTGNLSLPAVSAVASHEAIELLVNPYVNEWCEDLDGSQVPHEPADPVESTSYTVLIPDGREIQVSDFATPHWFNPLATTGPTGALFSYCNTVDRPFMLAPGGYYLKRDRNGDPGLVFGDTPPALWRLDMKSRATSRARAFMTRFSK